MQGRIDALDAKIRACMNKHGITFDDLNRLRRMDEFKRGLSDALCAFKSVSISSKEVTDASMDLSGFPSRVIEYNIQNMCMDRMLRDAVKGFSTEDRARYALFCALMDICDEVQADHYSNMMGRAAHQMAREKPTF